MSLEGTVATNSPETQRIFPVRAGKDERRILRGQALPLFLFDLLFHLSSSRTHCKHHAREDVRVYSDRLWHLFDFIGLEIQVTAANPIN